MMYAELHSMMPLETLDAMLQETLGLDHERLPAAALFLCDHLASIQLKPL